MIEVAVRKRFGAFTLDVDFRAGGRIIGLFGRSGSGKTTLVNAIAGLYRPDAGRIRIDGATLFDAAAGVHLPPEARRLGYVFQDGLLFPHLSVRANLHYGRRRASGAPRIDEARVIGLLGLAPLLGRAPGTLSGGEKQRVAIGRALLAEPRILLMDEPLASLDAGRRGEILDYIERLRDELAIPIVYVTHSVSEIARLADTVVLLAEGKVLACGEAEQVMNRLDLKPHTGRYEAGALIETAVAAHDPTYRLTTLHFEGGELVAPQVDAPVGARVRARIKARDVSLAIERPHGLSILNVLEARVTGISTETGPVVDVELAVGEATLLARITRRSLEQLDVREGRRVYALVKAVSFDRRSVGYA